MPDLIAGLHVPGAPQPESRFAPPDARCPLADHWTSTDGDSTEIEVSALIYGLVRGLQPRAVVETGTAFGQTTAWIAKALRENGHGYLYALENDPQRYAYTAKVLGPHQGAWVGLELTDSLDWVPPVGTVLDFVLLDSLYELRVPEFRRYLPWMRPGTVVAFHDTAPGHGAHRLPSGLDLQTEIETELAGLMRCVRFPTPRGLTLAEVSWTSP